MNQKVEPKAENPPIAPAVYNAFVATAQLREIRLIKSEFTLRPGGLEEQESWRYIHSCEINASDFDAESGLLMAFVSAEAYCLEKRKRVVSTKCRYLIIYTVDGEPEQAVVDAFSRRVARFAAYPYFRAHFAELMSQAGVAAPPLPIIKERRLLAEPKSPPVKENQVENIKQLEKS
jgi:hypothetical protein